MPTHVISGSRGLITNTASLSTAGGLRIAQDVVIRRPVPVGIDYGQIQSGGGLIEPRRSYEQFSQFTFPAADSPIVGMFEYDNQAAALGAAFYLVGQTGKIYRVDSPTLLTPIAPTEKLVLVPNTTSWSATQTQTSSATNYIRSAQMNGNVYFCTKYGVYVFDGVTGNTRPRPAGIGRCPDLYPAGQSTFSFSLAPWSAVGYRVTWGFRDSNQNLILGPPSGRFVQYSDNLTRLLGVRFSPPSNIASDMLAGSGRAYIYQIYRTAMTAAGGSFQTIPDPGDAMTLIYQGQTTSNADIFFNDPTPDGFIKGPDLYTNANQEGIQNGNSTPPACADIASFKGSMLYANCSGTTRSQFTIIGAPSAWNITAMSAAGQNVTVTVSGAPNLTLENIVPSDFTTHEGQAIVSLHPHGWPMNILVSGNNGLGVNGTFILLSVTSNTMTYRVPIGTGVPTAGIGGVVYFAAIGLNGGQWVASASGGNGGSANNAMLSGGTFVPPPTFGLADSTSTILGGTPAQNIVLVANAITQAFARASLDGKPLPLTISNIGGVTDPPGVLSVEAQNPGPLLAGTATTTASVTTILCSKTFGSIKMYPDCGTTPLVPVSDLSVARMYYSKTFQPEAVPLTNYFDIGDRGAPIRRIISTRDSVFIFKDDGVYRLSDDPNGGAKPTLFDPTLILVNPNLVCAMDNQVFMLSTRGFFQLSTTGAREFGLNIRDITAMLVEAQTTSLPNVCIGNERDQTIYFTIPGPGNSTWSLSYNLITHTWTQGSTLSAAAPMTWPGQYYKGTLSSSLKALHSGVILRHSNRDTSVSGTQIAVGDIFQEAVVDQNDQYLAANLVSDSSHGTLPGIVQEALNCLPPPGDRYYFRVVTRSGSIISMTPLSGTLGVTPAVGDAIYQLGQTTQYWTITGVNGASITVAPYVNSANAAPSVTGTTTFNTTPGACQLLKPLNIALEWSGFNAGNDSKMKHWNGAAVLMDELCSATDTFNVYSYTEIDQVPQTAFWPPAGLVVHPVYSARILLPVRHQRSRRVHLGFTGGQALKFTVISGIVYESIEHAEGRETE